MTLNWFTDEEAFCLIANIIAIEIEPAAVGAIWKVAKASNDETVRAAVVEGFDRLGMQVRLSDWDSLTYFGSISEDYWWLVQSGLDEPTKFDVAERLLSRRLAWWRELPHAPSGHYAVAEQVAESVAQIDDWRCGATNRKGLRCRNGGRKNNLCKAHQ